MSIISGSTKIKVSSTLDKSTPRKSLVDRDPETCWTSAQGLPQWVQLNFPPSASIHPTRLSLTFQGGFACTQLAVHVARLAVQGKESTSTNVDPEWTFLKHVYPEDVNRRQEFDLDFSKGVGASQGDSSQTSDSAVAEIIGIKLVFEQSSDFFGRITLYDLDIYGEIS